MHRAVTHWCEKQSGTESGKKSHSVSESARRTPREIQMKFEELKSLVDIPKLPPCFGKPDAPEFGKIRIDASEESNSISSNNSRVLLPS